MVRQAHHPEPSRRANLKFQYPMTKTFTAVVPYRCTNLCPPVIMPFAQMLADHVFGILNLGHWNLFDIWFLVLGIFVKQENLVYSINYLF